MSLDKATLDWLERRKIGMCCRCEHYYTDSNDFGNGCQWIPPEGFVTTQCYRFKHESYVIDKGDFEDAAEFEATVSKILASVVCGKCLKFGQKQVCPFARLDTPGLDDCRLKHARLMAEEQMEANNADQ